MNDRDVLEWIAQAQVGDALPDDFPIQPRLQALLLSIGYPAHDNTPIDYPGISAYVRAWLEER